MELTANLQMETPSSEPVCGHIQSCNVTSLPSSPGILQNSYAMTRETHSAWLKGFGKSVGIVATTSYCTGKTWVNSLIICTLTFDVLCNYNVQIDNVYIYITLDYRTCQILIQVIAVL